MRTIDQIHFHHSADESDAATIEAYHIAKGWGECAYHVIIEKDGQIKVMKNDDRPAYSVGNYLNETTWAVCMVGDFTQHDPGQKQWENATAVVREKARMYSIPRNKVLGHREARANSACPGFSDAMCERFRFDVFNTPVKTGREAEHMFIETKGVGFFGSTVETPYFVHNGNSDMIYVTLSKEANVAAFDLFGKQLYLGGFKAPEARVQLKGINGNIKLQITDNKATVQQRDTR